MEFLSSRFYRRSREPGFPVRRRGLPLICSRRDPPNELSSIALSVTLTPPSRYFCLHHRPCFISTCLLSTWCIGVGKVPPVRCFGDIDDLHWRAIPSWRVCFISLSIPGKCNCALTLQPFICQLSLDILALVITFFLHPLAIRPTLTSLDHLHRPLCMVEWFLTPNSCWAWFYLLNGNRGVRDNDAVVADGLSFFIWKAILA